MKDDPSLLCAFCLYIVARDALQIPVAGSARLPNSQISTKETLVGADSLVLLLGGAGRRDGIGWSDETGDVSENTATGLLNEFTDRSLLYADTSCPKISFSMFFAA